MPSPWQVEHLRFTVFAAPNAVADHTTWWQAVIGTAPDEVNQQPKASLYQAGGVLAAPNDSQNLVLQVQESRIDWALGPSQRAVQLPGFSTIGEFHQTLDMFTGLVLRWLPSCPAATRIALAGVLLEPQQDKATGYRRLQGYLRHVQLDPESSSDFLYQINRPRETTTGVPALQINRLTKWSVAFLRGLRVSLGAGGTNVTDMRQDFVCRLEFDINTPGDFVGPLPADRLEPLLREADALIREIADRGDVP